MIYGVWRDGWHFIGSTPVESEAVALMRESGLSETETEQLLRLAVPEGWATVPVENGTITLVLLDLTPA